MTRNETRQIMAFLREAFPQGKEITKDTVTVWSEMLHEFDFEIAKQAAKNLVEVQEGMVMPPIASLIKQIKLIQSDGSSTKTALWAEAFKAIKRGTRLDWDEFRKLPQEVQEFYRTPSAIKEIALLDASQIPNEKARFLNNVQVIIDMRRAQETIPYELKQRLESGNGRNERTNDKNALVG